MAKEHRTPRKILKVILDSNALFVPLQFKIDIFNELKNMLKGSFELVLLSPVEHELRVLSKKGRPKIRSEAAYALKLAEKCRLIELEKKPTTSVDDVITEVAQEWNSPVFTNDKQLKKRLRNINVPVIYVRQKSYLEIEGRI